ncbi:MAG TPA: ABC transporter ATP-binding protein [Firmicutes bacterium]|nr:ABC transporter ATP-binding protein [Bacillota bacterium]
MSRMYAPPPPTTGATLASAAAPAAPAGDIRLLKRILAFAVPHWQLFILSVLLLLGGIGAELAQPYLLKVAIDNCINVPDPDQAGLIRLMFMYLGVSVAAFILNYSQANLLQKIARTIIFNLRMTVFGHLQKLSLSYYDHNSVGRLVTRVCNDTEAINQLFSGMLVQSLRDIFVIAGVIVVMFGLHPRLAAVSLLVLPLIFAFAFWFRKIMRRAYDTTRFHLARLNAYLAENLAGMRTIQIFTREARQLQNFKNINTDYLKANLQEITLTVSYSNLLTFLGQIAVTLVIWYGGGEAVRGFVPAGTLYAFISYIRQLYQPIHHLTHELGTIQAALTASAHLVDILDEKPKIADPPQPVRLGRIKGRIDVQNVWFAYNEDNWVLKDISFAVAPGQTVAFVGATGAGKSSIINLISRLYDVQKGRILIDGIDVRHVTQHELRRQIAVVQQDVFLFAGTILDNIRLGRPDISEEEVRNAAKAVGIHDFIESLPDGYYEKLYEGGLTLSTGQRQLISFARALAHNPAVLILDEATAHIDTETESLVQAALKRISQERTTLIIAHRLSTIQHADLILVLDNGRIIEKGRHEDLLALGGHYARLYELSWTMETDGQATGKSS